MAKRGYARVPNGSGSEHVNIVGVLAYRGVKLIRHAGVTWAPRAELHAVAGVRIAPNDVKGWTKARIIEYAKDRDLPFSEHWVTGHRGGRSLRVNIGAGTGTSYRSALVDLLGYEERERWRKAALDLGLGGTMLEAPPVGQSGDSSTDIMKKSAEAAAILAHRPAATAVAASTQLPIEGSEDPAWARMGITFGGKTDDLFRESTLPAGWKKDSAGSDPRGMGIYDAGNRKRGTIFYKAAFYDRKANMYPDRRFMVEDEYDQATHKRCLPGKIAPVVVDMISGKPEIVFRSTPVDDPTEDEHGEYKKPKPEDHRAAWDLRERLQKEQRMACCAWLDEHYPGNDDPAAWWNPVHDMRADTQGAVGAIRFKKLVSGKSTTIDGTVAKDARINFGDGILVVLSKLGPAETAYLHVMQAGMVLDAVVDGRCSFHAEVIPYIPSKEKAKVRR
jgi:hypothetical protein